MTSMAFLTLPLLYITFFCRVSLALLRPESYDDVFIDPNYVLKGNFSKLTSLAQTSIQTWATELAAKGPWTVTNKTIAPPSGDYHDYMSWAPYFWPNCTSVGNTTELTQQQIWLQCPYHEVDGIFNPDGRLVDNIGAFSQMADAVLYNTLAWAITNKSDAYAVNAVNFIDTWFLNNATMMNPNLNYAQMERGPNGQVGDHTGILDLKSMTKVLTGILILRQGNSTAWTPELDSAMISWTNQYIGWLQTAPSAIAESQADNNHGSFYFVQMASLQILVGDLQGALNTTQTYFDTTYMAQIAANGEQPFEAVRTRPYHYRIYNLCAMSTLAKLGEYLGWSDGWTTSSTANATILTAFQYTAGVTPFANETSHIPEFYPLMGSLAAQYGDPNNFYASWLYNHSQTYSQGPWFFWSQPLSDHGILEAMNYPNRTTPSVAPAPSYTTNSATILGHSSWVAGLILVGSLMFL